MTVEKDHLRMAEALLFAAVEPLDEGSIAGQLPDDVDVAAIMAALTEAYADRGVNVVHIGGKWSLRTASDLKHLLERHVTLPRRLSRAAVETLAIIAYHQPVTRGEVEEIRGVALSRGTLDVLLEAGWIKPVGRRRTPGRPATWGTTPRFLEHFSLNSLGDLPGVEELKAAGLLDSRPIQTIFGQVAEQDMPARDGEAGDADPDDEAAPPLASDDD